jgi:pyridoxamine 5'-phosphate oxidase family protein
VAVATAVHAQEEDGVFTDREVAFIKTQRLLRLATVAFDGQPDADAVGFVFDGSIFIIGGHQLPFSRKYKNIAGGNHKVSLILDDLVSVQPWTPQGIKIHGVAKPVEREGQFGPGHYLEIYPLVSWSWGIEGESFQNGRFTPHKTVWTRLEDAGRA